MPVHPNSVAMVCISVVAACCVVSVVSRSNILHTSPTLVAVMYVVLCHAYRPCYLVYTPSTVLSGCGTLMDMQC